jgi:dTDP-4-dehydrorhamnose 3,5-epimerase
VEVRAAEIPDVKIIKPPRYLDQRGFFSETYNKRALEQAGIHVEFVQDNHSLSVERSVVRGLHYQTQPFAQDKLLRVARGAVFDVAVDLRRGSPTFGKHVSFVLSAEDWNQILIPQGFAHGFATLQPNTEVIYKVSNYYSQENDTGVFWADPELGIEWPVSLAEAIVSDKDERLPRFSEVKIFFD